MVATSLYLDKCLSSVSVSQEHDYNQRTEIRLHFECHRETLAALKSDFRPDSPRQRTYHFAASYPTAGHVGSISGGQGRGRRYQGG